MKRCGIGQTAKIIESFDLQFMVEKSSWHTIGYLLLLRCKIVVRFLKELGWIRSIFAFFAIISLFLPIFEVVSDPYAAIYSIAVDGVIILGVHFYRKDQHILQSIGINKQPLYFVEYVLISLPVFFVLGYLRAWLGILVLISGCVFISMLPVQHRPGSRPKKVLNLPAFLPYEWSSGIRSQKWIPIVLLLTGLIAGWFNLFLGWIFIFIITATVASFYKHCESVQFILLSGRTATAYICQKLLVGISCYGLLTGILWVEMVLFYPDEIIYTLLFLLANLLLLIVVIAAKYAFYRENMNIESMTSIIFWIGCTCLIVPYLPPVLFLLLIWLMVRGHRRLKREVYAFH